MKSNTIILSPIKASQTPEMGQYYVTDQGAIYILAGGRDCDGNLNFAAVNLATGYCFCNPCTDINKAIISLARFYGEIKIQAV